jgi:tetratricopeptide (TPR) repeat protein
MTSDREREFHRKVATDCFNRAWDLLDRKRRTGEESLQMLQMAHTSRYHWGIVGTPKNRAVGEWQLSRIYAELGQPRLALQFAKSCLATCKKNGLSDILHTADEAMARAYAAAKNYRQARISLERARRHLDSLALDKGDRKVYLDQINETEALIRG